MREQIKTQPTKFEIQRWLGPVQVVCEMPVDITHALIKMSDQIIEDICLHYHHPVPLMSM